MEINFKTKVLKIFMCAPQASSSSDSLDGPCVDYAKSYDAVVFDVLKVTPEEFAVSMICVRCRSVSCSLQDRSVLAQSVSQYQTTIVSQFEVSSLRYQHHLKELYQRYLCWAVTGRSSTTYTGCYREPCILILLVFNGTFSVHPKIKTHSWFCSAIYAPFCE